MNSSSTHNKGGIRAKHYLTTQKLLV